MYKIWMILILAATAYTQTTIAVRPLESNLPDNQARAITSRVKETAAQYATVVDRDDGIQGVLTEHALRQSGAVNGDGSLGLTTAQNLISGNTGGSPGQYSLDLSLVDVKTGQILRTRHATVLTLQNLLTVAPVVTKALLQGTSIEEDERIVTTTNNQPIIIGTERHIQEVHVYEHKAGTHGKKRFIPCSFCQGRGKVPCQHCGQSGEKDCPACSINSSYKGIETHGQFLTGHWSE